MSSFGQPGDSTLNTDTFNLIPDKLPSHPCVFVNRVDLERSRQLIQEGGWANVALQRLLDAANVPFEMPGSLAEKAIPDQNARILTHAKRQILAFHLTGKQEYYDRALTVFQQIASAYLTWPLIDDHIRAMNYGLAESRFTINLAQVYDLLTAVEPDVKDRDLFLKALARTQDTTDRCQHKTCGNHNTWNLAARLAAGLAMGRLESLSEVLYGWEFKGTQRYGLVHQLRHDILSDGLHWERTPGYHYYTLMAIVEVVVMLEHAGIDLWHTHLPSQQENEGDDLHRAYGPAGTKSLKAAFDAPFYQTTGNGDLCLLHDSGLANLRGVWIWGPLYELAYQAYEDPKYAWLLNRIDQDYQNHPERKYPELPMSLQPPAGEFDFLRLHQREIPEGSFSLSENCPISLEGTHKNHCTLFPTTGAGILRHSPGTTDPAVHFFWGPHSAGHQSPAALHVDLHALGRRITNAPDAGGYEDPMHLTWVRTTIAHNTVTVDETPMFPYDREEDSIWRADNRREHVSDSV
ncbi:MAG: alginate lyase family protein, partial [bacterium]|nr:alginate lyase family protein [bacterium]